MATATPSRLLGLLLTPFLLLASLALALAADQPVVKDNAREYLALRESLRATTLTPEQMVGPHAQWRGRAVELFGKINAHTATSGVVSQITFTLELPGQSELVSVRSREINPPIEVDRVVHVLAELATDARPTDAFLLKAIILESDLPATEQRYAAAEVAAEEAKRPNRIDATIPIDDVKPPVKHDPPQQPVQPPKEPEKPLTRPGTEPPQLTPAASKGISPWKAWVAKQNPRLTDEQLEVIVRSVIYYSALYGVDHRLMFAVIKCESSFNPSCVSHAGAIGLCQLMPGTARGLGVDPWDLERNIAGGTKYLAGQLKSFAGRSNWEQCSLALASYNAGPGAVKRAGGIPNIPETVRYVEKVTKLFVELYKSGLP